MRSFKPYWTTVAAKQPRRKHMRLSQFLAGKNSRFCVAEHWMPDSSGGTYFKVYDANLITDAQVRAGGSPPEIGWSRDLGKILLGIRKIEAREYLARRARRVA